MELEESKLEPHTPIWQLFTKPSLRRPTIVVVVMALYHSFCGAQSVLVFSTQLFVESGIKGQLAKYATSGVMAVLVVGNVISSSFVKRFQRKTFYYVAAVGIAFCTLIMTFTLKFNDLDGIKYINVVVAFVMMAFFAVGPACLFWVFMTEIFPHSARGAGLGLGLQTFALGFFAHNYIFPQMLLVMQSYTFLVFTAINILMVIFLYFVVPQTDIANNRNIVIIVEPDSEINNK